MNDTITTVQDLKKFVRAFVEERKWVEHHTPKNLAMAIAIEAAELMEKFQWCDTKTSIEEIRNNRQEIVHELADVAAYVLSFAELYNIDLSAAIEEKMEHNRKKYPLSKVTGSIENVKELRKEFASNKEK